MTTNNTVDRPLWVDYKTTDFQEQTGRKKRRARAVGGMRMSPRSTPTKGAVRLTKAEKPGFKHLRKVGAGALAIFGGILVTTQSNGTIDASNDATKTALPVLSALISPTFFFNDSDNALGDQQPLLGGTSDEQNTPFPAGSRLEYAMLQAQEQNALFAEDTGVLSTDTFADSLIDANDLSNASYTPQLHDSQSGVEQVIATSFNGNETTPTTATVSPLENHPAIAALRQKAQFPDGAAEETVTVKSGDTLSKLLNDRGVKIDQMPQLLTDEVVQKHLSRLSIGQKFQVVRLANGDFHSLSAKVGNDNRITIRRSDNGFATASIDLPVEKERVVTSGTIDHSLYVAAEQADLKQSTIMELSDIFQWELDFARDIRKGDQFSLVYDRLYREGKYIGDGDILAAEFVRGGKHYQAFRYTDPDGNTGYYTEDGRSKKRTFLRHPVDVVRITSRFDKNRLHPVLHKIRAHNGVDYGSPTGTPIRATADGTVRFAGSKSSYGKTVILNHGTDIRTLYAHMSRISNKVKNGKRVKQGDVIGYVGATGRVTGAHLHYEFQKNGKHVDPLKVELPAAAPLQADLRDELRGLSADLLAQMRSVLPAENERVAKASTE